MRPLRRPIGSAVGAVAIGCLLLMPARTRAEVGAFDASAAQLTAAARGMPLLIPLRPWRGPSSRISAASAPDERALAEALARYARAAVSGRTESLEPLREFTRRYPGSMFAPALLVDLGALYRQTAQLGRALEVWQRAWLMTRRANAEYGRTIADTALGELLRLRTELGQERALASLLDEAAERALHGTPAQRVSQASAALIEMRVHPASTFRCGPIALAEVARSAGATPSAVQQLRAAEASARGSSLAQLHALAERAGLASTPVFRRADAPARAPALIHLRVGHWAALLRSEDDLQLVDPARGSTLRISARTLASEATGYELIPSGALPVGYRVVGPREAERVWGRGTSGNAPDAGATGPADAEGGDDVAAPCIGCTHWSYEPLLVSLALHARPLGYTPALGPALMIDAYYSQRDSVQPSVFDYGNIGSRWTLNWLSFVSDELAADGGVSLYRRGGGSETFSFPKHANTSALGPYSASLLSRELDPTGATSGFIREFPDGSQERFEHALANKFLLSAVVDPQGNAVTLDYDEQHRLQTLTDALGQRTQFAYDVHGDPLKITQITDPFGRVASFAYDVAGNLASITAATGEQSSFSYGAADFIETLETPTGTSHFEYGDATTDAALGGGRWLQISDALGRLTRIESRDDAPGLTESDPDLSVPTGMRSHDHDLQRRNTFIWNPAQLAAAKLTTELDYGAASVIHWLGGPGAGSARVVESRKPPLEGRIWFDYPDQDDPSQLGSSSQPLHRGRVLDDDSTQLFSYAYNARGNIEKFSDPAGRSTQFTYADNAVDVITIANVTGSAAEQLSSFGYDDHHRPTSFAAASGRSSSFEYNERGQLVKRSDGLGDDTTYRYDEQANLLAIEGPSDAKTSFAYDAFGRLSESTDRAGLRTQYGFDDQDRLTSMHYRDGTSAVFRYQHADLVETIDRTGRSTAYDFDAAGQLTALHEWPDRSTRFEYGPDGTLASLTDANGHVTSYRRDLQGRLQRVEYADGSARGYRWEQRSSRLQSLVDAKQETTQYAYTVDDRLARIAYPDASVATASVLFDYDPAYPRLRRLRDGLGETTYAYYPLSPGAPGAGLLKSITSPTPGAAGDDLVEYSYDALDRLSGRKVDGEPEQISYDALSRPVAIENPLGAFSLHYDGATTHLVHLDSAASPKLVAKYGPADAGSRLSEIDIDGHDGTPLARFGYRYDVLGRLTAAAESFGRPDLPDLDPGAAALAPPAADNGGANVLPATLLGLAGLAGVWLGRRRRELRALLPLMAASFCSQPQAADGGRSTQITRYAYDRPGRLYTATLQPTAAGPVSARYEYRYDSLANPTDIRADGPSVSRTYSAANAALDERTDSDGNPLARAGQTLVWDAAGRVTQISAGDQTSEFSYDGLSRLVRIVEKQASKVRSDRAYFYCGPKACLEHDNLDQGAISKRYYAEGVRAVGRNLYYVSDYLGSVRLLVDDRGATRSHYAYEPYGAPSKLAGDLASDFQFAGYFWHAPSGLHFARYRALDSSRARWLSRDPLAAVDGGGPIYSYAGGDPQNQLDLEGIVSDVSAFASLTEDLAPRTDEPPSVPGVVRRRARTQFVTGVTGAAAVGGSSASAALSTSSEWIAGSTSGQTLAMRPAPSTRNETLAAMPIRLGTP